MSNLIKPQLYPCQSALLLQSFSQLWLKCILFTHLLPQLPALNPLFLHPCLLLLPLVMASGSTLTLPSARAQTNQSQAVLFHKDQKQLVSFHISCFFLSACAALSGRLPERSPCMFCVQSSLCPGPAHMVSCMAAIMEIWFEVVLSGSVS